MPNDGRTLNAVAKAQFIELLQLAYSGELGAALAYAGHAHALRRTPELARQVRRICRDEVEHRAVILRHLKALGAAPVARRERKLRLVGFVISVFCHVGGWFWPMWGAGRLEAQNIHEYELAARLAFLAGLQEAIEDNLVMAEVEWDHELFFRTQAASHWLWRLVPHWPVPPPRASIRATFAEFTKGVHTHVEPLRIAFIIR
jgi:hypothetical protein